MSEAPIIELDTIDSTNNYAMSLIDANKAQHGLTIVAKSQAQGKGQRGKSWVDEPGQSLLMSIVTVPKQALTEQFLFSASVAVAIANVLQNLHKSWDVRIKWPNDIILNDKKAGGILIENVLRGNTWPYSVVGLGLNVLQKTFPDSLPHATSLKIASGNIFDIALLRNNIRENILATVTYPLPAEITMKQYDEYLYKRGCKQSFSDGAETWEATLINAHTNGTLAVQLADGAIVYYHHGQVVWEW